MKLVAARRGFLCSAAGRHDSRAADRLAGKLLLRSHRPAVLAGLKRMAAAAEHARREVMPVRVPDIAAINAVGRIILMSEASALMAPFLDRRDGFGADVLALFDQGRLIPATDYVNAQRLRRMMQRGNSRRVGDVDCLLTPTAPMGAPKIGRCHGAGWRREWKTSGWHRPGWSGPSTCSVCPRSRCHAGWTPKACRWGLKSSANRSTRLPFCAWPPPWKTPPISTHARPRL